MKSYLTYFKIRFITNLQYRVAAIAGVSTQFFFGIVYVFLYLAIYNSNPNAEVPMDWNQLVTYLWLQQIFYAMIYPYEKDEELLNMIKNGNLAYELIRPQNFFMKFYIKMVAKKVCSTILRFLPILLIVLLLPKKISIGLPASTENFILFGISIVLSCLLISAFCVLIHILSIFTIDSKGIMSMYGVVIDIFSGSTIPIPFFPNWLKTISNLLPFRFISDLPFRVYSNSITVNEGIVCIIQSSIWIIISILLGLILSKVVLKKAVIQGG